MPLKIIQSDFVGLDNVEIQYHIFSKTAMNPSDLSKGPRFVDEFMKSHNIQKFQSGGWLVTTTDNNGILKETSEMIYNRVLSKLQQIWLSDSITWDCSGVSAYYQCEGSKVCVYDVILKKY